MNHGSLESAFSERNESLRRLRGRSDIAQHLCPDSTPIQYFGSLSHAEVLTVGINPASSEFVDESGEALRGGRRRFAHESDLIGDLAHDAELAIHRQDTYFTRRPDVAYWPWFRPLDLFSQALGMSFRDGTVAHTDIMSSFATVEPWGKLKSRVQTAVSQHGFETMLNVIHTAVEASILVLIGATVRREFQSRTSIPLHPFETTFDQRFAAHAPVVQTGNWGVGKRRLRVVAVNLYCQKPLRPLSDAEIPEFAHEVLALF